jgi:hypothetical protein
MVAATGLDGVQDSPQQIDLILEVVDSAAQAVYLPMLARQ